MIETLAWVLPRPASKYPGCFPLHFEIKLLRLLGLTPDSKILQPFGGKGKYGIRMDIDPSVEPDVVGDAHCLPFEDNAFDLVLCDPPYSDEYAKRLYGTPKLKWGKWTTEAVRVCKYEGYVVIYHCIATPSIRDTILVKRILIENRRWHKARIVHIHQKRPDLWEKKMETPSDYGKGGYGKDR